jgi:cardiolipin synthase A/B
MSNPEFLQQAFTRAAGAALVPGNRVRLLQDARENYPAWLEAIASAERTVFFENYMFCEDEIGLQFQRALIAKARAGVRVRVLYDWLGSLYRASARYWRALRAAGVDVRCFNPARLSAPIGALHRDHRKMLAVDGRIGFITGLCIGRMWAGDARRGIAPWRDTGIELRGPALRDIEEAFAQVWAAAGSALPEAERVPLECIRAEGPVDVRIVASAPGLSAVLRIDQLIASAARSSLWLTDAYFASIPPYVQALQAAARDGVDVRLLVPSASDIPVLRPLSQAGYRPLLEAGIRVFEWKGSMLHAKTAVADGRWARVGSSNLNVASWIGNFELDALIEDEAFAAGMEEMYLSDLARATEIVLRRRRRRLAAMSHRMRHRLTTMPGRMRRRARAGEERPARIRQAVPVRSGNLEHESGSDVGGSGELGGTGGSSYGLDGSENSPSIEGSPSSEVNLSIEGSPSSEGSLSIEANPRGAGSMGGGRRGSASRAAAGALRIGRTVGAALSEQRVLAPTEARLVAGFAVLTLALAAIIVRWPLAAAVPVAVLLAWISLTLFAKALALRRERRRRGLPTTRLARTPSSSEVREATGEPSRRR